MISSTNNPFPRWILSWRSSVGPVVLKPQIGSWVKPALRFGDAPKSPRKKSPESLALPLLGWVGLCIQTARKKRTMTEGVAEGWSSRSCRTNDGEVRGQKDECRDAILSPFAFLDYLVLLLALSTILKVKGRPTGEWQFSLFFSHLLLVSSIPCMYKLFADHSDHSFHSMSSPLTLSFICRLPKLQLPVHRIG